MILGASLQPRSLLRDVGEANAASRISFAVAEVPLHEAARRLVVVGSTKKLGGGRASAGLPLTRASALLGLWESPEIWAEAGSELSYRFLLLDGLGEVLQESPPHKVTVPATPDAHVFLARWGDPGAGFSWAAPQTKRISVADLL